MKTRLLKSVLRLALAALVLCMAMPLAANDSNRPNILFIAIDDMNDWAHGRANAGYEPLQVPDKYSEHFENAKKTRKRKRGDDPDDHIPVLLLYTNEIQDHLDRELAGVGEIDLTKYAPSIYDEPDDEDEDSDSDEE